jgi:hypothetical protein
VAGRRVLITGVANSSGTRLAGRLAARALHADLMNEDDCGFEPDSARAVAPLLDASTPLVARARPWSPGAPEPSTGCARGSRAFRARPCRCPCCPAPARRRIGFGQEAADDPALVLELVDDVRARLQEKVYDSLVNRKGAL